MAPLSAALANGDHGRLLLRRSGGRGPRGCAAGLLHLLTSGHSVGRLPSRNGAGCGDDQRHHGRTAGLLHLLTSGRPVGRLLHGRGAGHADTGGHRGRAAGLQDGPGPGRLHNQPNHLGAGGVPLSRRPGYGDGLEHCSRAAHLLHHRTSRRPPCRQARSHGGSLGPANSSALSGRRRGRRGGGRHRRADPGPHGRLTVKLDGSPQQRLQRGPGHAHRGSERGRLHPDPSWCTCQRPTTSTTHCTAASWATRAPTVPPNGVAKLHFGAHFGTVDVYGLQILDATLETGNAALLLKHKFLDGGADDVTLATLGKVLLEPTLNTLGIFLVPPTARAPAGGLRRGPERLHADAGGTLLLRLPVPAGHGLQLGDVRQRGRQRLRVTGTFLGTPSQGVWSTARLDFLVPPGGIAKLHFGAFGGSIPGLVQQSAGTACRSGPAPSREILSQ